FRCNSNLTAQSAVVFHVVGFPQHGFFVRIFFRKFSYFILVQYIALARRTHRHSTTDTQSPFFCQFVSTNQLHTIHTHICWCINSMCFPIPVDNGYFDVIHSHIIYTLSETRVSFTVGNLLCVVWIENSESAKNTSCPDLSRARNFCFTLLNSANSSFLASSGRTQHALKAG